jgi:hypothetical protein
MRDVNQPVGEQAGGVRRPDANRVVPAPPGSTERPGNVKAVDQGYLNAGPQGKLGGRTQLLPRLMVPSCIQVDLR